MGGSKILKLLPVLTSAAEIPWYLKGGVAAANCIAAYQAIGAASLAASYVNLANPGTYDLTAPVAPTWNATDGWIFDGAAWLASDVQPADARTWSMFARFSGVAGHTAYGGFYFGYVGGSGAGGPIFTPNRTAARRYYNGQVGLTNATTLSSGVMAIVGGDGYANGIDDGNITTEASSGKIGIGAARTGANTIGGTGGLVGNIQAVVLYDTILTPTQVVAVTNAMAALPPP